MYVGTFSFAGDFGLYQNLLSFWKKSSLPSTSFLLFPLQALVSVINSFHEKIVALEGEASELERTGNDASKAAISRSTTAVWQRWTRLRAVAQDQEKLLEDAVDEWMSFNNEVITITDGLKVVSPHWWECILKAMFCPFFEIGFMKVKSLLKKISVSMTWKPNHEIKYIMQCAVRSQVQAHLF